MATLLFHKNLGEASVRSYSNGFKYLHLLIDERLPSSFTARLKSFRPCDEDHSRPPFQKRAAVTDGSNMKIPSIPFPSAQLTIFSTSSLLTAMDEFKAYLTFSRLSPKPRKTPLRAEHYS